MNMKFHEICAMSERDISPLWKYTCTSRPLFPMVWHQTKRKIKKVNLKLNCSINLHLRFYKMSFQTDSVDQNQTAQTVQCDVGFILSVNLWDIFLSKI